MSFVRERYVSLLEGRLSSFEVGVADGVRHDLECKNIYVYGAGNVGGVIASILTSAGYDIAGFFDRSALENQSLLNLPVMKISDDSIPLIERSRCLVIVSIMLDDAGLTSVISALRSQGFGQVRSYHSICALMMSGNLASDSASSYALYGTNTRRFSEARQRLLEVAGLWEDEQSRETYFRFVEVLLSSSPSLYAPPVPGYQYFPDNIPFSKGYQRFIDGGAFTGDTAKVLLELKGVIEAAAFFEPEPSSYLELVKAVEQERVAREQLLIPCGLWSRTTSMSFRAGASSASCFSPEGDVFVQCVSLDQAIPDFSPTFLKMDIEGAECDALAGAERMIRSCRPDLAISAYHRFDHMWEIPLMIRELCSDYSLYLRSHGENGLEAIVYATIES